MNKRRSDYFDVVVESIENRGEPSSERIRVRPLAGQGLDADMRVECSEEMRTKYPVGTKFRIRAKVTSRKGGARFLYSHYKWPYQVVTGSRTGEPAKRARRRRRSGDVRAPQVLAKASEVPLISLTA